MAGTIRKLTTILAADIAGYSRLVVADEEGTVSRLRAHRSELINSVIAAHNGRILTTTGDAMLIEFGTVADAVRVGVDVQRGVAARNAGVSPESRVEFRVGIHRGDVILDREGEMKGEAVETALRLDEVCEPGGVCLSGAAHDQIGDPIDERFVDRGEMTLKNIARKVRVFSVDMKRERK